MPEDNASAATPATEELPPIRFFRAGGFNQIILRNPADLRHLRTLDQTLWVASSCPTRGLDLEEATLDFIDDDHDQRIRPPEILESIDWILDVLRDPSDLPKGLDVVRIEQINPDSADGAQILQTIQRILQNLGQPDADSITLAQAMDRSGIFAAVKSNGDGIIPASAADSPEVAQLVQDILNTQGGETDQSGEAGVTASGVADFFTAALNYLQWWVQGHPGDARLLPPDPVETEPEPEITEAEPGQLEEAMRKEAEAREKVPQAEAKPVEVPPEPELSPAVFTLGEQSSSALAAINAIRTQVEDFFEQVEVAAFDARAVGFLNFNDADLQSLQNRSREEVTAMMAKVPLARVAPDAPLPLRGEVNPVFAGALATLNRDAVAPVFGKELESITQAQWRELLAKIAPYEAWLAAKTGEAVESLGIARIGELLNQPEHREALEALIAVDAALAAEIAAVSKVEKLLRYHRDLFRLLRNYVSLPEFYDPDSQAIFQMGSLLIDGCMLNLCVEVDDLKAHSTIAAQSGIYLVYCTAKRVGETRTLTICAAVTSRDAGRITVGKNAVFYDRFGKDWDAKVVQVATNPISLREAIWAPFKKIGELISAQMEKISAARQQAMEKGISDSLSNVDKRTAPTTATQPAAPTNMGAMLAGGGVAIAALSSSMAYVARTLQNINDLFILYTIAIVLLLLITPSLIIGFFKLRRRDIGMVLEACGWAINGRMRINLGLAKELTHIGRIPRGAIVLDRAYITRDARRRRRNFFLTFFAIVLVLAAISWWILEKM